jgi:hypothetical protein
MDYVGDIVVIWQLEDDVDTLHAKRIDYSEWQKYRYRGYNNGLPPNDPNRDHKPSVGEDLPMCKWAIECHYYLSSEYYMCGRRHWCFKLPISSYWDQDEPMRKVLSVFKINRGYKMLSLTILFSCRVFRWSSSSCHQNHWDVICRLMSDKAHGAYLKKFDKNFGPAKKGASTSK